MVVKVSIKREYIPEWNGNKGEKTPFVVKHKAPTMNLYEELIPKPKIKVKIGKEGTEGGETELSVDTAAMVKAMVTGIEGLTLENDSGEQTVIRTADDLYGPNAPTLLSGLTDELGRYFQELLTSKAVDTKN